jgi:cyclase
MVKKRLIPCLDVAGGRVVKGVRFRSLRDVGDPVELAQRYSELGADELVFLDITAPLEGRGPLLELVERAAEELVVPFTVGGGVSGREDARALLRAGADKVAVNRAAVDDPRLLTELSDEFGSQAVVCAIDARAGEVVTHAGANPRGRAAVEWACEAVERGAGELLVTSIDRDGTQSGFDTALLRAISSTVEVPVIASGGAAGPADFVAAVVEGGADAVLAASIFHRAIHSIGSVKAAMAAAGLPVRLQEVPA